MHAEPTTTLATLDWLPNERQAFIDAALNLEELFYYVDKEVYERCRDQGASLSNDEWRELAARGGYHLPVCLAFGPASIAMDAVAKYREKYPDSYHPVKGILAFVGADALPSVLEYLPKHIDRAIGDVGPIASATLALPIASLLGAPAKQQKPARAWLLRHPKVAAEGLIPHSLERNGVAMKALDFLLKEHKDTVRTVAVALGAEALLKPVSAKPKRTKTSKDADYEHIGKLYYLAHHATPLVLGDLKVMRDWRGSPEGVDEFDVIELPQGNVVVGELQLLAPNVFVRNHNECILAAQPGINNLIDHYMDEPLQTLLREPFKGDVGRLPLRIDAGLALSVAYNATPVEGSNPTDLDEMCFHEDVPRLPLEAPTAPLYARELVVVPLLAGDYEVTDGITTSGMFKMHLKRKG